MWSNRGESARVSGNYEAAAKLYAEALAIAGQIGSRESALIYLSNLAGVRLELKQFEQAEVDLRQVIGGTSAPNSCSLSEAYTFLGEACLGQGKFTEAGEMAQKAIKLAQESESPLYLGAAWRTLGRTGVRVFKDGGRTPRDADLGTTTIDSSACFAESFRVFGLMKAEGEQARTLRDWAEHEFQQGRRDEARRRLEEARDIFLHLGATLEAANTGDLLRLHDIGKDGGIS